MNRPIIIDECISEAITALISSLQIRRIEKGDGVFVSRHEILGILTEEFKELIDATKSNKLIGFQSELMDIAVAAVFGFACSIQKDALDW